MLGPFFCGACLVFVGGYGAAHNCLGMRRIRRAPLLLAVYRYYLPLAWEITLNHVLMGETNPFRERKLIETNAD